MTVNKHGSCPSCDTNWDMGEITEVLSRLNVFHNKGQNEVAKIANSYGWTPENKARFSNVIITTFPATPNRKEMTFYICPKCMNAFDIDTGTRYTSIINVKNQIEERYGSDSDKLCEDFETEADEGLED